MTGQTISHYRILDKLGEGGMGVVYKAEDTKLRRTVALKFLPPHALENRERFLREAQAAAALNHPNICTVFEIDEEHGFLAMELIDGVSVKDKIAARPLPLEEALDIAMQTCAGLQAAHEKGIVHRDIKSANLMLTAQGQVKIMDFGLAQVGDRTRITKTGSSLGTPAYMSPEQAKGDAVDRRTDIWSLGVVLYEMLAGRLPFRGDTEAALARAILDDDAEPLTSLRTGLTVELDRIIAKVLAKTPAERYQNIEDLVVDLRRVPHTRIVGAAKATRRRLSRWVVRIVAAVLMAAIATVWELHRRDDIWENPLVHARFTRLTDFEGDESDAAISPDGKFVAFLSARDGVTDVWLSQLGTGEFVNLTKGRLGGVDQNTRGVGFSGDGSHVWLGGGDAKKYLVPAVGGPLRPFLPAVMFAWSSDGERLAYHSAQGDPIFIADRNGNHPKKIYEGAPEEHNHYLGWSHDDRHIFFAHGDPGIPQMDLWRVPVAGGGPERITHQNGDPRYPTPLDEHTLLYTGPAEDGSGPWLWAVDLKRRVTHRISVGIEHYTSIAANASRNRLVATVANPASSLWTIPIAGHVLDESAARRVDLPAIRTQAPRYGPGYFVYLSSKGGGNGIWKSQNGVATELWKASDGDVPYPPAVSPDGSQICFSFRKQGRTGLYLMTSDGTGVHPLAESLDVRGSAAWSPDGKWIAIGGNEGQRRGLFKVAVQGGAPQSLVNKPSSNPVWSPDGSMIVYAEATVGRFQVIGAVRPDGAPHLLPADTFHTELTRYFKSLPSTWTNPAIRTRMQGERVRFMPEGRRLIVMAGMMPWQQFWMLDLTSGNVRQLTNLRPGFAMRTFDISPDGKNILFDRSRENSDIVLIELGRK